MNTKIYIYLFAIFFCSFYSCSQEELLTHNIETPERSTPVLKSYVSSQEWENKQTVKLKSGIEVNTPWSSGAVQTSIPKEIREDIKWVDGWVFVYSNLYASSGKDNYMIFYNRFTGLLKGFYYLEEQNQQNNGMWKIEFEGANKLLNGVDYFTVPITSSYASPIWVNAFTITTNNETRGFEKGWNAFQTMLTYDGSYNLSSLKLKVSPYNNNSTRIKLTGELATASSGSMISTTTSSGGDGLLTKVKDGMVTQAGTQATNWIGDKIKKGVIKKEGASILTGGVSALLSAGVDFIFGSFFGKSTEPTTTTTNSTLEFTTKGSITTTGNLYNTTSGLFSPLSNIPIDIEERLGSWNLTEQPVLNIDTYGFLTSARPGKCEYFRNMWLEPVSVSINPSILPLIDHYYTYATVMYYKKLNGDSNWNRDNSDDSKLMYKQEGSLVYSDGETEIHEVGWLNYVTARPPIYPSNGRPYYHDTSTVKNNFVIKVRVIMYPKAPYETTPIVTTRSFIPKIAYVAGWK